MIPQITAGKEKGIWGWREINEPVNWKDFSHFVSVFLGANRDTENYRVMQNCSLFSRTLPNSTAIGLRSNEIMTNHVVFWKHVCCLAWGVLFCNAIAWERMFF